MNYYHRDENGVLKGKYNEAIMKEVTWHFKGSWQPYKTKDMTTRAFVVEEDRVMNLHRDTVVVYFWKGDKLVEMVDGQEESAEGRT